MTGPELWERAKRIIPGGGQLLSKRAEMYAPGQWPAYYDKAEGCEVWSDGKRFFDFTSNGLGACPLGYANRAVNEAVAKALYAGSMATLNCREEVELAERLIALHPWSDMARFARTGGEAMAVAVRIARAATGRDNVLIGGYHGWHDWYLAANLDVYAEDYHVDIPSTNIRVVCGPRVDPLRNVLLPGLNADGVPRGLAGTTRVFHHNNCPDLLSVCDSATDVAAIVIEIQRGEAPTREWLDAVQRQALRLGAVVIVDEITSGFRKNLGGAHLLYGFEPDIAVFGKALGNGVPISAVIGKREVMEHAQHTFISSTFWTERLGFAAALATLDQLEQTSAIKDIQWAGQRAQWIWEDAADRHNLPAKVGHPDMYPLSHCYMPDDELKTLRCQLMLQRGILDGGDFYPTAAHDAPMMGYYAERVDEVFAELAEAYEMGDAKSRLLGPVVHSRFERLTT